MKHPHHRGDFDRRAKAVRIAAYADPDTRCQRCGRTLVEHPPTRKGKPPAWQAGHVIDGQVDGQLGPEVQSCNASAGARLGNAKRKARRRPGVDRRSRVW